MDDNLPKDSRKVEDTLPETANEPQEKHTDTQKLIFKKPDIFTGPRKDKIVKTKKVEESPDQLPETEEPEEGSSKPAEKTLSSAKDKEIAQVPYTEPSWGGKPDKEYKIEILKSGVILETIDLTEKSFHVIGRLPNCDISLAHPTISRFHAVLQYRKIADGKNAEGLYIYDLESTHGTFWNGSRIKPRVYARVQGGHMVKFGCSQRKFIFVAPPEDEEEESKMSVTELKEKRRRELEEQKQQELMQKLAEEEAERLQREKEENEGINWGMGEDAVEETDLNENPFAETNNEELFLDDPKKTLRGWFEREGLDMQYQTEDRGIGQFLCWVDLPIDSPAGKSVRAEALVKGKKKEAVVQCALEACRILDRHGLLRQSSHESRKKKSRNWEEDDFYDSDEDNFFDRTGTVEKKRNQRMKIAGKVSTDAETYDSLVEKYKIVTKQIAEIEEKLRIARDALNRNHDEDTDALDAFMDNLSSNTWSKSDITRLKVQLNNVRKDETQLLKLINIAKPANLPSLKAVQPAHVSPQKPEKRKIEEPQSQSSQKPLDTLDEPEPKSPKMDKEPTPIDVEEKMEPEEVTESEKKVEPKPPKPAKRWRKPAKEKEGSNEADDSKSGNYSTWVPPMNQSGDGRTSLNEKYGY